MVLSQCFCHHNIIKEIKKSLPPFLICFWLFILILFENAAHVVSCALIIVLFYFIFCYKFYATNSKEYPKEICDVALTRN